jgi:hypothetical protein
VKCCGFVEFWRELGEKTQKKWKFAKKLVENAKFFLSSRDFPSLMYMSLQRYHELFLAQVQVLDEVGVSIADEALVNDIAVRNGNVGPDGRVIPDDADRASCREMSLAIRFIRGANSNYKSYLTHLCNSYLDGNDVYLMTLHEAYNILQRRETNTSNTGVSSNDGVAFATCAEVICFNCGEPGHYAQECPHEDRHGNGQGDDGGQGN